MKKIAIVALLLITAMLLASCGPSDLASGGGGAAQPKSRIYYEYFDTVCTFYDYTGGTDAEFKRLYQLVEDELKECHELFDIYHTYDGISNAKSINDNAGGDAISVDARLIELFEFAKETYTKTDGHVNVMMGSVLSAWHNHRAGVDFSCDYCDFDGAVEFADKKRESWICPDCGTKNITQLDIPTEARLTAANAHTGIDLLEINKEEGKVRITDPDASLDLGAVAKGFTCERIARMLEREGVYAYALDFGGNLRVGEKTSGEGWKSGIKNPDLWADEPYVRILDVKNGALVTSGSYERFYTVDGVKYHHIINKDTLMPKTIYTSVSILTTSSAIADALSTAFFNMSEDEIRAAIGSFDGTEVTLVYPDGKVVVIPSENNG